MTRQPGNATSGHKWVPKSGVTGWRDGHKVNAYRELAARYVDATFNADAARLCGCPKAQAQFEAEADALRLTLPAHVRDALKPLREDQ
jgi:hypothetical protein